MAATILQAFEELLLARLGPPLKNRVWQSPAEEPKYAGLPRLVVEDAGRQRTLTSETVIVVQNVDVRCEDRGRPDAEKLAGTVCDLFPDDGPPPVAVDGASVTWCRAASARTERVQGVRPEDGDWRYAATLTFSVRTERPRAKGD
jgi:hypothetical protein